MDVGESSLCVSQSLPDLTAPELPPPVADDESVPSDTSSEMSIPDMPPPELPPPVLEDFPDEAEINSDDEGGSTTTPAKPDMPPAPAAPAPAPDSDVPPSLPPPSVPVEGEEKPKEEEQTTEQKPEENTETAVTTQTQPNNSFSILAPWAFFLKAVSFCKLL